MQTEDRDMVKRTLAGERGAFDEIVARYQDGLYRHLLRLTGRPEEAEDLCQEAFVALYRSLRRLDPARPIAPFLFTIATNAWRKRLRGSGREVEMPEEQTEAVGDPVSEQVFSRLEHQQVLAAVAQLQPEQREAVSLFYDQGLSYREISGITGAPVGTVSTRLKRALETLRQALAPGGAGMAIPVGGDVLGHIISALQGQGAAPASIGPAVAHGISHLAPAGAGVFGLWKEAGGMMKAIYVAVGLAVVGGATLGLPRLVNGGSTTSHSVAVSEEAAPVSARYLILGALKNQGMGPTFRSGYVEMLHEQRDLMAREKQAGLRDQFQKAVEQRLEGAKERGVSAVDLTERRRSMEEEADQNIEEILGQLTKRVTYQRCLFSGNALPGSNSNSWTRIDRIDVDNLDVLLSEIPAARQGVVVNEGKGRAGSVCAGYGSGIGAKQAYLQTREFFPRFQDFGRIYGAYAFTLSLELMDNPKALDFTFNGEKAKKWAETSSEEENGPRIIGQEIREGTPVYIVEGLGPGSIRCKIWIAPGLGFAVSRLEQYGPRGVAALLPGAPSGNLAEVMECRDFVHLEKSDIYFPLLTTYTKYGADGKANTVDVYKIFGPQQVRFNQKLRDDDFRISFKRGMDLEDLRPASPGEKKYYPNGLQVNLRLLPSELAALVDAHDPRIVGNSR